MHNKDAKSGVPPTMNANLKIAREHGPRLVATGTASADFTVTPDIATIGSASGNNFIITDSSVSRRHATISLLGNRIQLTDLGATNGTYVNGNRISAPVDLNDGDEVRFGAVPFTFVNPAKDSAPANAKNATPANLPPRSSLSRVTLLAVVATVFVAGFAITQYMINFDRLQVALESSSMPAAIVGTVVPTAISSPRSLASYHSRRKHDRLFSIFHAPHARNDFLHRCSRAQSRCRRYLAEAAQSVSRKCWPYTGHR